MKTFLVTSDLSARSDRAVERAAQLARAQGAKLVLAHVIDDDLPDFLATQIQNAARKTLEAVLVAAKAPEDSDIIIETGETVQSITALADRLEADLVVLGLHRVRPFWDMFSGTTMERIVRALRQPVLLAVLPVIGGYKSVLCGIDLSPACVSAAKTAAQLAPDAEFTAFHAVHIPYRGLIAPDASVKQLAPFVEEARLQLNAWWEEVGMPKSLAKPRLVPSSVHTAFAAMQKSQKPDLVAVGAHGRPRLAPTLLGSFTENLIRRPECDTLVVRG